MSKPHWMFVGWAALMFTVVLCASTEAQLAGRRFTPAQRASYQQGCCPCCGLPPSRCRCDRPRGGASPYRPAPLRPPQRSHPRGTPRATPRLDAPDREAPSREERAGERPDRDEPTRERPDEDATAQDTAPTPDIPDPSAADDFTDPSGFAGGATAQVGGGLNTPMLGRADISNRRNLFDTMSAVPLNRVWFSYQDLDTFNNGVVLTENGESVFSSGISPDHINDALSASGQPTEEILQRRHQSLYRYGLEVLLDGRSSLTLQGQYHGVSTFNATPDDFDNPQLVYKRVLSEGRGSVMSGVLGLEIEDDHKQFSISDRHTRIYPGLLAFTAEGSTFSQAGVQFGLPLEENQVATFDWGLSAGWWLLRHPVLMGDGNVECLPPGQLVGMTAQVEFFGHHAISDTTVLGKFGIPADSEALHDQFGLGDGTAIFAYDEPTHIIDLTYGLQFVFANGWQCGFGASFPLTGGRVRGSEFISTMTRTF